MGDTLRWYPAGTVLADLTNQYHHLRAASEEAQRRMRRRYPQAVLALLEVSWRQDLYPSFRRK